MDLSDAHERLLVVAGLGFDPETGEAFDEEELGKAFDLLDSEAEAKILATGFVCQILDDEIEILDKHIKRLTRKRDSRRNGKGRLIDRLRDFMAETGILKAERPSLRVTLGKPSQRVEIDDKCLAPAWYNHPTPVPDKVEIAKVLKAGRTIPGAKLVDGPKRVLIK